MRKIIRAFFPGSVLVPVLLSIFVLPATGEDLPRNERNSAGTLTNQDYFISHQYREMNELRYLLESHHLTPRVYGDVTAGRYHYALFDVDYVLERMPNHPRALQLIGTIAKLTKKPFLAVSYFKRALALYPQYALTHAQYGSYLADVGQVEAGIGELSRAIELDPKLLASHVWLAKVYLKAGNMTLAREHSEAARRLGFNGEVLEEGKGTDTDKK
jgi:Tfp pilus assembly protein PilF